MPDLKARRLTKNMISIADLISCGRVIQVNFAGRIQTRGIGSIEPIDTGKVAAHTAHQILRHSTGWR